MDAPALGPAEDMHETLMRLRAGAALGLQLGDGLSQAEACRQVGIDPKTYRKYIRGSDELLTVREGVEGALVQGVVQAVKAYLAGLERLEQVVADPETAPRDLVAALKFLEATLVRFVGVLPQASAPAEGEAVPLTPFNFEGPVTIKVMPKGETVVVDGASGDQH